MSVHAISNDVLSGDTIKNTHSRSKAASFSFDRPGRSIDAVLPDTSAADVDDVEMLPSPGTEGSSRRRRRNTGFRARVLREWERMHAAWFNFGLSSSGTHIPVEDPAHAETDDARSPVSPVAPLSQNCSDDAEVDEVIVDSLTQTSSSNTHSDTPHDPIHKEPTEGDQEAAQGEEASQSRRRLLAPYYLFRRTIWKGLEGVFNTHFAEPDLEKRYRHETWTVSKPHAATSALFLLVNWILCIALFPRPLNISDRVFLYAFGPFTSICPAAIILSDLPTKRPIAYQILIGFSTWSWGLYQVYYMTACGYYTPRFQVWSSCNSRDFVGLFYWACALPTIGLFGLKMTRFTNMVCVLIFTIITSVFITPYRPTFLRNALNFMAFNLFLLYTHYFREQSERHLYILQDRLIVQNKQTHQAQMNERAEADSKRRLTSYVFHEVRVPLNTALLAAQNVQACLGAAAHEHKVEFTALSGSLNQMSAVLNDILDFNRMESGKFAFVAQPFSFHTTMRSLFVPLKLSAEARKLRFVADVDPCIDRAATKTAVEVVNGETIGVGVFVGDEQRLRQVVTNLASNACKFTPAGGEVRVSTRLLEVDRFSNERGRPSCSLDGSTQRCSEEPRTSSRPGTITVRIEVTDTGSGIHRKDMIESKLFSSFSQTEQGRLQGGKGTGLGLAIVRQIVQLSGGRLRVRSRVGVGTTFMVDLPLRLQPLGGRSTTPVYFSSGSRPPTSNSQSSPHLSPLTHQARATAKALADPILSVPAHTYNSSQLMALARVQPVRPQSPAEEEEAATHAAASIPHTPSPLSPATSGSATPVDAHLPDVQAAPAGAPATGFIPGLRVLVVDDDNMTRTLMKRMLTRVGCVVDVAENGRAALDALTVSPLLTPPTEPGAPLVPTPFAVVFLDNQMPVMSGLDAVRAIRAAGRAAFVVGVTGNALLTDQKEFLDAGADHVLTKPVFERDLRKMLVLADTHRKASLSVS